tara:strand:- start:309 stop:992 length:684 start_codon:yes stop_codon:yes gene_type:complete
MKKIILSIVILTLNFSDAFSHVDHYSKYNKLEYELFRNNKLIGFHNYIFKRSEGNLSVLSEVKFKVTKLGVDLYTYFAKSEENYKKNVFSSFSSKTNQNKKEKYVNINFDNSKNELIIDGTSYKGNSPAEYIVGTWWNHEIVKANAQISAISGRIIHQNVKFVGKETININGKDYKTLHFNFSSSDESLPDNKKLNTDIWYEENTYLWIKAAFTKRGKWEYRLKNYN